MKLLILSDPFSRIKKKHLNKGTATLRTTISPWMMSTLPDTGDHSKIGFKKHLLKKSRINTAEPKVVYYDVTNYYFEIDKQDGLRKKG